MGLYKVLWIDEMVYCFSREKVVVYNCKNGEVTDVYSSNREKVGCIFYMQYDIEHEDVVFVDNKFYFVYENCVMVYDKLLNKIKEVCIQVGSKNTLKFKSIDYVEEFIVTTTEDEILFLDSNYNVKSTIIGNNDEITDMALVDNKLYVCTNSGRLRYMTLGSVEENGGMMCCKAELLEGHEGAIMSISEYNGRIVTTARDCKTIVWNNINTQSGTELSDCINTSEPRKVVIETHLDVVNSCDICKDIIVTVSNDRTLQIFTNTLNPKHIFTKVIHEKDINAVRIHEERKIIATASHDKTVKIFNFHGEELHKLTLHKRGVWTLDMGTDIMATGSSDETIRIWSLNDYECIRILEGHNSSIIKVKLYDSCKKLLSCDNSGIMRVWDVKRGRLHLTVDFHTDKVWSIIADKYIYTASIDGSIRVIKDNIQQTSELKKEEENLKKTKIFDKEKYKREHSYMKALEIAYEFEDIKEIFDLLEKCIHMKVDIEMLFLILEKDKEKLMKVVKRNLKIFKHIDVMQVVIQEMMKRKYFTKQSSSEYVVIMQKIYRNADELAISLGSMELLFKEIIVDRFLN